jgi:hypothetical protein
MGICQTAYVEIFSTVQKPNGEEAAGMATQAAVDVDARGRTSLARVRSHRYDRYTAEELPDGTIVLTPAVTISAVELAALRDPKVRAAVAEAKSGDRRKVTRRPVPQQGT